MSRGHIARGQADSRRGAILKVDAWVPNPRGGRCCSAAYAPAVFVCGVLAAQRSGCTALARCRPYRPTGGVVCPVRDGCNLLWAVSVGLACALLVAACSDQLVALQRGCCRYSATWNVARFCGACCPRPRGGFALV